MHEQEWLAERFEEHRTHLRAVAYRMLGSLGEADDAVQEAWLRLSRSDTSGVENLGGWLTTVVARGSLNMLRSRNVRREEPLGGSERFEHHEQTEPDGVRQERLMLRIGPVRATHDRVGEMELQRLLAPRPARAQRV